jgi:tetratricopeptide (TPR) repeat protein
MCAGLVPLTAVVCAASLATGCNATKFMADSMVGSLESSKTAFNREESPEQARAAAPASLGMIDGFIVSSPKNKKLLLAAAEMNANAAFALIEPRDELGWVWPGYDPEELTDWARALYSKAQGYAMRALELQDPELAGALRGDGEKGGKLALAARLATFKERDKRIPALFWSAFAWGGAINLSLDDPDAIAALPRIVDVMERLAEVAPDYNFAGAHTFLAVFYSSRGRAAGGDLEKANAHYKEVFERVEGRFLVPYVLYARFYCVALGAEQPARAREQFEQTCHLVLDAARDVHPDQILANTIAKRWAGWLIEDLDNLIFPPLPPETEVAPESDEG